MFEARVENFLDTMEFRTPQVLHLFKAHVDGVEAYVQMTTKVSQPGIVDQNSDQYGYRGRHGCQSNRQNLRVVQHSPNNSTENCREFSNYYRRTNVYSAVPA